MLRGGGKKGKTAMRHAKEWDNNPVTRPGLIEKKLKGNEMRQVGLQEKVGPEYQSLDTGQCTIEQFNI
jgi:hypothetical protein